MATFGQIAANLEKINIDIIIREVFVSVNLEKWAVEQIQKRLYNKGETGSLIKLRTDKGKPYYTPKYTKIKQKRGEKTSNVTLYLEGGFYRKLKVKVEESGFQINTNFEWLTVHFQNIYSSEEEGYSDILSLTDREIGDITKKANKLIFKKIHAIL